MANFNVKYDHESGESFTGKLVNGVGDNSIAMNAWRYKEEWQPEFRRVYHTRMLIRQTEENTTPVYSN